MDQVSSPLWWHSTEVAKIATIAKPPATCHSWVATSNTMTAAIIIAMNKLNQKVNEDSNSHIELDY